MNTYLLYGIIAVLLLLLEVVYFRVADRFNIIDKPNQRSSHSSIVLRGGGIIFLLALWIWLAFAAAGWIPSLNRGLHLVPAGSDVGCRREFH